MDKVATKMLNFMIQKVRLEVDLAAHSDPVAIIHGIIPGTWAILVRGKEVTRGEGGPDVWTPLVEKYEAEVATKQ